MIDPSRAFVPKQTAAGDPAKPPGGFSHVKAVGALPGGLWTFSLGGKLVTAKSAAALVPGAFYSGVFIRKNGGFEFLPRAGIPGKSGAAALNLSRLPPPGSPDFARFLLSRAFLQAGLPLPQGPAYGELLKFVTTKKRHDALVRAALAVRCGEKGLFPAAAACESLWAVLEGYSGDNERRRGKDEPENRAAEAVRESISGEPDAETGGADILHLFNHLAPGEETWAVYPYRCTADGLPYSGSLRVLYSRHEKTARVHVLFVRAGEKGDWHFVWKNAPKSLKIFYSGGLDRKILLPEAWKRKFRKLGLYSDDIVYNGENFDGFSGEWEDSAGIDEMA